jgi:hypothetical protein
MALIRKFGEMWARNPENLVDLKKFHDDPHGVYVLYYGSMPVYVGRGCIRRRVRRHGQSASKRGYWDHFSWYEVNSAAKQKEIETLLLRMLPFYLRSLTKQEGRFERKNRVDQSNDQPIPLKKPKAGPYKKSRKKQG